MSLLSAISNPQTNLPLAPAQAELLLAAWLGQPVRCTRITPLHGGMINTVLRLEFDRAPYQAVIKLNTHGAGLAEEARALETLDALNQASPAPRFPSPRVYRLESAAQTLPYAFLLMENLPGLSMEQARLNEAERLDLDRQLAEALLGLHTHTRPTYGGIDDPGTTSWPAAFLPRLQEVRRQPEIEQRLPGEVINTVDQAIRQTESALAQAGPPTLIHSDIWAANLIIERLSSGWRLSGIVDPGLQYADVEMELAYLEVFGASRPAFFAAYTARQPLRPGYEYRRLFYWLNTCLIHVWLFGDDFYRQFTAKVAEEIIHK